MQKQYHRGPTTSTTLSTRLLPRALVPLRIQVVSDGSIRIAPAPSCLSHCAAVFRKYPQQVWRERCNGCAGFLIHRVQSDHPNTNTEMLRVDLTPGAIHEMRFQWCRGQGHPKSKAIGQVLDRPCAQELQRISAYPPSKVQPIRPRRL